MANSLARGKTAAAGYYNLLEALADPKHEEHEVLRAWVGGYFDPQAFSVDKVNQLLSPARPRGKARRN